MSKWYKKEFAGDFFSDSDSFKKCIEKG